MLPNSLSRHPTTLPLRSLPISLPLHSRYSSTASHPLITVRNIPAPHRGSIRILSLNNPATRNAISRALLADLSRQITNVQDEGADGPTRCLILASEVDGAFCAGADLKERKGWTADETTTFLTHLRATLTALSTLPIPTLTALSSLALGGGLELALATSLRVFASTATVGLPETRLGIIPGAGGTYRLPALIGRGRALDLLLTGRRVRGPEAYFLGICERLVDVRDAGGEGKGDAGEEGKGKEGAREAREKVLEGAVGWAREICEGGPLSTRAVVRAVREGRGQEGENEAYEGLLGSWDRREALRAFGEKRRPEFKGR